MAFLDLTGKRFGRLQVTGLSARTANKRTYWDCVCDCGASITTRADALRAKDGAGAARSCGCLHKEIVSRVGAASRKHDYKGTRIYNTWSHIIDRCHNPNNVRYADYGGRGITVCERWRENFLNFLEDMSEMPEGLTLDRENNALPYSKENCRWADHVEQNRNRRGFLRIVEGGKKYKPSQFAKLIGSTKNDVIQMANDGLIQSYRAGGVSL